MNTTDLPTQQIENLEESKKIQYARAFGFSWYSKRTIIAFLKDFFSKPENTDNLFVYYPDEAPRSTSEVSPSLLRIEDRFAYDRDNVDTRPALVVVRQGTSAAPKTLGNSFIYRDMRTGNQIVRTHNMMDMQIIAYSREGDEAEFLADIVYTLLSAYRAEIRELLGWDQIDSVSIGPETPTMIDGRIDYVSVPIQLSGQLSVNYSKKKGAPRLSLIGDCLNVMDENSKVQKF